MTPDFRNFLQSYLDWVEKGAPDGAPFLGEYGLCYNTELYDDLHNTNVKFEIDEILEREFGENALFPFNQGKMIRYYDDAGSHHLNEERINWIKEKLAAP